MRCVIILLALLQGCAKLNVFAGVAAGDNSNNGNKWQINNPLGVVRVEHDTLEHMRIYCEHLSEIGEDDGRGLNTCGIGVTLR